MQLEPPLQRGTLVRRYKRFLADILSESGESLTIHCPNTGSMQGCLKAGAPVWYSRSDNKKRKYAYTWEMIEIEPGARIGINTHLANQLVREAWQKQRVTELTDYVQIEGEKKFGLENSRIDWRLTDKCGAACYLEVKNVTLVEDGCAYFPDAVTTRGQKHLRELTHLAQSGTRAMLFFCVQHTAARKVAPADQIDSLYGELLREAVSSGVEVVAYRADVDPSGIELIDSIPLILS
ncbi:MAG TPA: DNA/RNA nuclease SfsA [Gammaproteobacteria bacterium]|nr:DNA/RNA nuclease SfsA [Gammaproteobacteria bacterium]